MTPENEAKKAFLERYRWDVKALEQIDREITQLRLKILPGGISYDGMPHGSGANAADLANYAVTMDEYLAKFKQQRNVLLKDLSKIVFAVEQVENVQSQVLLRYRYIELKSWREIAAIMCYAEDYVKRHLHSKALNDFEIP